MTTYTRRGFLKLLAFLAPALTVLSKLKPPINDRLPTPDQAVQNYMDSRARDLARSAVRVQERMTANIFNRAFKP